MKTKRIMPSLLRLLYTKFCLKPLIGWTVDEDQRACCPIYLCMCGTGERWQGVDEDRWKEFAVGFGFSPSYIDGFTCCWDRRGIPGSWRASGDYELGQIDAVRCYKLLKHDVVEPAC